MDKCLGTIHPGTGPRQDEKSQCGVQGQPRNVSRKQRAGQQGVLMPVARAGIERDVLDVL